MPIPSPDGDRLPTPGVAAFDFDGTLTVRDTLIPFLGKLAGRRRLVAALAAQARRFRSDQDAAKLDLLARLTTGVAGERFDRLGAEYAVGLHHRLRPDVMARLRWHRSQGHTLVIVSASLGTYLRPFGDILGLDEVIAVELDRDVSGRLTGTVTGGVNNRGPEKERRLRAWLDRRFGAGVAPRIWAYGDTSGDEELLAMADHPTWVRRGVRIPAVPPS